MELVQFIFWEAIKALSLALLALLSAKAVSKLQGARPATKGRPTSAVRIALYVAILALVILGARSLGGDVAAEVYWRASERDLNRSELPKAYVNASRAVRLRPAMLDYWRTLARAKLLGHQYASLIADEAAFRTLSKGSLSEEDALRFALCHYFLHQYDQVIPLTQGIIRESRLYAEPYVLEGLTYTALGKYPEAEQCFLRALDAFPSQPDAVEGLAHVYFLAGKTDQALAVLNATAKYPFTPGARKRFDALKDLYEQ